MLNFAVDGQTANKLEKNLENIKDINEGKDLLLDLMREQYQKDPKSLDFLSFIAYRCPSEIFEPNLLFLTRSAVTALKSTKIDPVGLCGWPASQL